MRTSLNVSVLALTAVLMSGCGAHLQPAPPAPPPLEWEPCSFDVDASRVKCGSIRVPENRGRASTRSLSIAFSVTRAAKPTPSRNAIVFFIGGPGAHALTPLVVGQLTRGFAEDVDLVVFDPRGTGQSEPSMCPRRVDEDARIVSMNLTAAEARARRRRADMACRDALLAGGIDLTAYHSAAIADDADDLRRALGYERWTVMGESYGGAIAQVYANRHPSRVANVVLISPARYDDSLRFDFVRTIGDSLKRLTDRCRSNAMCAERFPDTRAEFRDVAERIRQEPVVLRADSAGLDEATFTVNAGDFIDAVDTLLMMDWNLQFLPRIIRAFRDREHDVMTAVVARAFGGTRAEFSIGMQTTVRCHDLATPDSRRTWERIVAAQPLEGELPYLLDACDDWGAGRADGLDLELHATDVPAIILTGGYDDRTSPTAIGAIQRAYRRSHLVVFANASHILPTPFTLACVNRIVTSFVRNPTTAPDASCATDVPPIQISLDLPPWAKTPTRDAERISTKSWDSRVAT